MKQRNMTNFCEIRGILIRERRKNEKEKRKQYY